MLSSLTYGRNVSWKGKASALEREEEEEQQERSFLKLSQARNWSLGIESAAPSNASLQAQVQQFSFFLFSGFVKTLLVAA